MIFRFNGLGYGIERNPNDPNFGNLDQSALVPGTAIGSGSYNPGFESFPLTLLPNYDYLKRDPVSGRSAKGRWVEPVLK